MLPLELLWFDSVFKKILAVAPAIHEAQLVTRRMHKHFPQTTIFRVPPDCQHCHLPETCALEGNLVDDNYVTLGRTFSPFSPERSLLFGQAGVSSLPGHMLRVVLLTEHFTAILACF
jgi:hypothetical protein